MINFNSLYGRLALALFTAFVLLGALLLWLNQQLSQNYQAEITQRLHHNLAEHIVHEGPLFVDGQPDPAAVEKAFHNMMILGKGFEFYLLSPSGELLNFSAPPGKVVRQRIPLNAINNFLQSKQPLPLRGPDPRSLDRNKIFSVAPVQIDNNLMGYLYIIINGEAYDSVAAKVSNQSSYSQLALLLMIALGFLLIALLGLFAWLTKPLRQLGQGLTELQQQGFDGQSLRLSRASSGEINQINLAVNELLERLQQQYQQVKSVDEMRRELLAHVSHDLRTPLAALQGYLETWLLQKRQQQTPDDNYIEIAHSNAEKIHRMLAQLLELASLESAQVPVNIETVVIAELVQDVLQKYQLAAQQKQVLLDVQPKDLTLRVSADIQKLERVFTNLIDNALRHCDRGDTITVRIDPNQQEVLTISVSDSGIGIPAADLPHIFDAHYKAANSVRGDSGNSGLGLAITRKLLTLHKSDIEVSSQVNQGTEFRFTLRRA